MNTMTTVMKFAFLGLLVAPWMNGCTGAQVSSRISSLGVSPKMSDVDMARSRAENRARRGLARMLKKGSMTFEYQAADGAKALRVVIGPIDVPMSNTRFMGHSQGVISVATCQRPAQLVRELQKLKSITVAQKVKHPKADTALRMAENRAYRKAISKALGRKAAGPVFASGKLTLIQAEEKVDARGAWVRYQMHVDLEKVKVLPEQQRQALQRAAVHEHEELGEWAYAARAMERSMKGQFIPSEPKLARLAAMYHKAGDLQRAHEKYLAASKVAINLDTLKAHLKVVQAMGDPAKIAAVKKKIADVEQMKGGGVILPKETPLDPGAS